MKVKLIERRTTVINVKFKKCCNSCNHVDVYTDGDTIYDRSRIVHRNLIIGYKHERVCKEYLDEL